MKALWRALPAAMLLLVGCTEAPTSQQQTCGAGTRSSSGQCVPALDTLCGEGTTAQGGRCVAPARIACGEGTVLQGSSCVSTVAPVACGEGTVLQGSSCVSTVTSVACGAGTVLQGAECVPTSTLRCGAGTVQQGSECIPASTLSCGTGTTQVGSACQPDLSKVCGTDTASANNGSTCVSVLSCGAGTSREGNVCRASESACGAGTVFSGGKCEVSPGAVCGAGTVWEKGQCIKPVQSPTLAAFSSATLKGGFYKQTITVTGGQQYEYQAVVTDLSQGSAEGWAQSNAALVGDGAAVHVTFLGPGSTPTGSSFVESIRSASSSGACNTSLAPDSKPVGGGSTYANFFRWGSTRSALVACALGGSVKVERLTVNGTDTARLTFNVEFSDGTLWQDKVFDMPWRQS